MTNSEDRARAISNYQDRKTEALIEGREVPIFRSSPLPPVHGAMLEKARELVADSVNKTRADFVTPAQTRDFYIVWFAKTLGNWKALVSTDLIDGQYWEVTYNGAKKETYIDHYVKSANTCVTDEAYASLP